MATLEAWELRNQFVANIKLVAQLVRLRGVVFENLVAFLKGLVLSQTSTILPPVTDVVYCYITAS